MADFDYNTFNVTASAPWASQEYVTSSMSPLIIGWAADLTLWGVAASQFFVYTGSAHFQTDSRRVKWTVFAVALFATINSALSSESIYHYATWQVRDSVTLESQTPVDCFSTIFPGIVGALVQIYFIDRAAGLFTNRKLKIIYCCFAGACILLSFLGTVYYLVVSWLSISGNLTNANYQFNLATSLWLYAGCVVDIQISVGISVLLWKRLKGFSEKTDSTLRQLIQLALTSASYTAITALIAAVMCYAIPDESIHANTVCTFFLPLSSLYMLSLLSTLNSREKLQGNTRASGNHQGTHTNKDNFSNIHVLGSHFDSVNVELPFHSAKAPVFSTYEREPKRSVDEKFTEPFSRYASGEDNIAGRITHTTVIDVKVESGNEI